MSAVWFKAQASYQGEPSGQVFVGFKSAALVGPELVEWAEGGYKVWLEEQLFGVGVSPETGAVGSCGTHGPQEVVKAVTEPGIPGEWLTSAWLACGCSDVVLAENPLKEVE